MPLGANLFILKNALPVTWIQRVSVVTCFWWREKPKKNKLRYHEDNMKTNLLNVYMFIEKTSRTICSGISRKSYQLRFVFETHKRVSSIPENLLAHHKVRIKKRLLWKSFSTLKEAALSQLSSSLSSLARKPKCRDKNHHTVLWSATGLESPNSPASKRASSSFSSIARAACCSFLLSCSRTSDLCFAARTLLNF